MCAAAFVGVWAVVTGLMAWMIGHPINWTAALCLEGAAILVWAVALLKADVLSEQTWERLRRLRATARRRDSAFWVLAARCMSLVCGLAWISAAVAAYAGQRTTTYVLLVTAWVTGIASMILSRKANTVAGAELAEAIRTMRERERSGL
jgi:hypothetical protein